MRCGSLRWELSEGDRSNLRQWEGKELSGWWQKSKLGLQCEGEVTCDTVRRLSAWSKTWSFRKPCMKKLEEGSCCQATRENQSLGPNTRRKWRKPETPWISYKLVLPSTSRQELTLAEFLILVLWDAEPRNQLSSSYKTISVFHFQVARSVVIAAQQ